MDLERRTIRRVTLRLVPFLVLCYFIAYLDRVNVGFAKLTMSKRYRPVRDSAFGLGAGIFFLAYFLFEVPSNLFLERFGARKWIARIMFSWGLAVRRHGLHRGRIRASTSCACCSGFAEAGFFPGIIFYLTLWFPAKERARIISLFMAAIPLSSVIGGPGLRQALLGPGRAGWACMAGSGSTSWRQRRRWCCRSWCCFYLSDKPTDAQWLAADERNWLMHAAGGRSASSEGDRPELQRL